MTAIGLDIGGANLKAAHTNGVAISRPFALWKRHNDLSREIQEVVASLPKADHWAVTMTGELCDCFATKRDGVRHILGSVAQVAGSTPVHVWRNDSRFASLPESLADPLPVAAANWLALAMYAGRFAPIGPAVLIDIGSTTTDIVPLMDGVPMPIGRTDVDRLRSRELVYTGVRRTPVCALLEPGEGMAEFFATTHDVYLLLGWVPENESDCDTADGRPATVRFARARLARMIGGDEETVAESDVLRLAERVAARQSAVILDAVWQLRQSLETALVAGSGRELAIAVLRDYQQVCEAPKYVVDLNERLGAECSAAACALAVATLLNELP